jgi:drug/metabolite transporter (DMT)-like permease
VGLWGIFGYHFLYFSAFHYAPPIEVSLMNYLWPLLIVVLSPVFLPEFKIRLQHILGALLGLCGAAVIVTGGEKLIFDLDKLPGYFLAALQLSFGQLFFNDEKST